MERSTRRGFLRVAGAGGASLVAVAAGGRRAAATTRSFDPTVDAFSFPNFSPSDPLFPNHNHRPVTKDEIGRAIENRWFGPLKPLFSVSSLSSGLVSALAKQLYVSSRQYAAANGHCYGISFTAQRYFEHPDEIPLDRDAASDFGSPEAPGNDPTTNPVSVDLDVYQTAQILDPFVWLGRRSLIRPESIDYRMQYRAIRAAVDTFGTASISLMESHSKTIHEVLVYDYERVSDGVRLFVYDPNFPAWHYKRERARQRFSVHLRPDAGIVTPYRMGAEAVGHGFPGYDTLVYNRWDRIISRNEGPDEHPLRTRESTSLRDSLLGLSLFTVDSTDVGLAATGPNDRPVERIRSRHMDRRRTGIDRMRYRYGAPTGTYNLAVTARRSTEYTVSALIADLSGTHLDTSTTRTIDAGETHEYVVDHSNDGSSLDPGVEGGLPSWLPTAGGVAAGLGMGVLGYAAASGRTEPGHD